MVATYLRTQLILPPFGMNFRFSHITAVPVPPQEAVVDFSSKQEVVIFAIFQLQDGSSSSFHRKLGPWSWSVLRVMLLKRQLRPAPVSRFTIRHAFLPPVNLES